MDLKSNKTVMAILNEHKSLQQRALTVLRNICENSHGEFEIDSNTIINISNGIAGCDMCNVKGLFINSEGKLFSTVITCTFGTEYDTEIMEQEAIEILDIIISDATYLDLECSL